jgi:hypothetical protein
MVVVDAGAVTFIDSAGLVFLVGRLQASEDAGRPLQLRATSPALDRVLGLTGLYELFPRPLAAVADHQAADDAARAPTSTAWGEQRSAPAPPEPGPRGGVWRRPSTTGRRSQAHQQARRRCPPADRSSRDGHRTG